MTAVDHHYAALANFIKTQSDRLLTEVTEIAGVNYPEEDEVVERQACIEYLVLHSFLWYNIKDGDERSEMICHMLDAFEATIA